MKRLVSSILIAGFASMIIATAPARAQNTPTPASLAYAKEILAIKNVSTIYKDAVPNLIERVKGVLVQSNLNYQKDLNEVSLKVAKDLAGREEEIGKELTKIYASQFTEQELKELLAFYKSPLGAKSLKQEPVVFELSRQYMDEWAGKFSGEIGSKFRAEMKARGKEI